VTTELTSEQVWEVIEKHNFGVLAMVTAKGEARTAGIVYILDERRLYIGTWTKMWKVRHVTQNPSVSVTIPIHKRVPFMPWIKVPAATITFSGRADVHAALDVPRALLAKLYHGVAEDREKMARYSLIEVTPEKEFLTYGIGMSLLDMRDPQKARRRVPVGA
jgi:general stress protein 26